MDVNWNSNARRSPHAASSRSLAFILSATNFASEAAIAVSAASSLPCFAIIASRVRHLCRTFIAAFFASPPCACFTLKINSCSISSCVWWSVFLFLSNNYVNKKKSIYIFFYFYLQNIHNHSIIHIHFSNFINFAHMSWKNEPVLTVVAPSRIFRKQLGMRPLISFLTNWVESESTG